MRYELADHEWAARNDGQRASLSRRITCGDLWFLAELFVAPGHQGRGVGNDLLARTSEHARKRGATTKSLITGLRCGSLGSGLRSLKNFTDVITAFVKTIAEDRSVAH
jgi:GNAT superfamily N-acetyltransferase